MAANTYKLLSKVFNSPTSAFLSNLSRDIRCSSIISRGFSVSTNLNMRFVQFQSKSGGVQHLGAQISQDSDIFDLSAVDSSIPNSLVKFLAADQVVKDKAARIVAEGKSTIPLSEVKLLAPVTKPDKVICVGLNYKDHCDEQGKAYPEEPMFFSKFSSTIVGPTDNILMPKASDCVDWECELAVVISKQAKHISLSQAFDYIFGYTIAQDVSARDWQKKRNGGQFLLGKSMDTFCPLGPCVVTRNKVPDPHDLHVKCWINGKLKQHGNTKDMVFRIDYLVHYLSQIMTLYPGDVILTGTPAGVGLHRHPPEFLKPGDVVESEIQGIGKMRNCVDWECELAVVIAKQAKHIELSQAFDYIFGYTIAQDVSARDWQKKRNGGQFLLGKSMDTFCPLGPCVVTRNKVPDPHDLHVKCWINGKLKQQGNTKDMVFRIDYLVHYLSQIMTLYPGDVILTGTPAGVGLHRHPPEFLKPGDVVESEIQGIGKMRNVVV